MKKVISEYEKEKTGMEPTGMSFQDAHASEEFYRQKLSIDVSQPKRCVLCSGVVEL